MHVTFRFEGVPRPLQLQIVLSSWANIRSGYSVPKAARTGSGQAAFLTSAFLTSH
jgi:hypothetical protein